MKTTMPAHLADYLAAATLAAASTDKVTPVITAVHIEAEKGALRATATDRYRVHQVTLEQAKTTGTGGVNLPSHVLKWIVRTLRIVAPYKCDRAGTNVTISTRKEGEHDTRITVAIDAPNQDRVTLDTLAIRGNFPPVGRLIEKAQAAETYTGVVALNLGFVGKVDALRPVHGQAARIRQTAAEDLNGKPSGKPGPVLVTYEAEGVQASALIQPNLLLR